MTKKSKDEKREEREITEFTLQIARKIAGRWSSWVDRDDALSEAQWWLAKNWHHVVKWRAESTMKQYNLTKVSLERHFKEYAMDEIMRKRMEISSGYGMPVSDKSIGLGSNTGSFISKTQPEDIKLLIKAKKHHEEGDLKLALSQLTEYQQSVLFQVYEEGLTFTAAAQLLGKSRESVTGTCSRALKILSSKITHVGDY